MTTSSPELELRVHHLEDIEAIKRVKYRYARLCDAGYDPAVADLFTEGGVWSSNRSGPHVGRAAIAKHFAQAPATYPWAVHMMLNPEIVLAGDSAQADWILLQVATHVQPGSKQEGEPLAQLVLAVGRYRDHMVRSGDTWRFAEMRVDAERITNLDEAPL